MSPLAILLAPHDGNSLIISVAGSVAGIFWTYKGFRLLGRKRLILNTPSSKVRGASMGLVEISGMACSPYVITSPMKQSECYYYHSIAWQMKQKGKNSKWMKVAEETLHVPFYVDDDTGRVLVDPRGAEMDLLCDLQQEYHPLVSPNAPDMPNSVVEFLARHGVDPDKQIKVEERCIRPKNFLFVLGTLSQNPGFDASVTPAWATRADRRKVVSATAGSGSPKNGYAILPANGEQEVIRLSDEAVSMPVAQMTQQQKIAAALSKAGVTAAGVGFKSVRPLPTVVSIQASAIATDVLPEESANFDDASGFDLHPPVVVMQGAHQSAFFISSQSRKDIIKKIGWKSGVAIWGGPGLILISVYLCLAHFHWL